MRFNVQAHTENLATARTLNKSEKLNFSINRPDTQQMAEHGCFFFLLVVSFECIKRFGQAIGVFYDFMKRFVLCLTKLYND